MAGTEEGRATAGAGQGRGGALAERVTTRRRGSARVCPRTAAARTRATLLARSGVLPSLLFLVAGHLALTTTASGQSCPELVGRLLRGPSRAVAVEGSHAYFGSGAGLLVADVSDPGAPTLVGEVGFPELVEGVAVSGGYAFVANRSQGLRVVDVSTPSSPIEVGFFDTPGNALGVAVSGGYAFVADHRQGLRVVDVSTPSSPTEVGFFDTPGSALGVAVSGEHAYVADGSGGLRLVDVSTPSSPTEIGFLDTLRYARGVAVSGGYAFVAAGTGGLRVVDVSTPSSPTEVGFLDTPGYALGVAVSGSYAYVAWDGLRVVDVSTPSSPTEVGSLDIRTSGVALSGGHAFSADGRGGLHVVDVSTPSSPTEVGFLDTSLSARGVAVSGEYAFVTDSYRVLRVVDISTPSSPTEVGSVLHTPDWFGFVQGVAVSGGYAYVAADSRGLLVVDVSTPSNPTEVGSVDTPGYPQGVAVSGGYAFVADGTGGLRVVDVSTPSDPTEVGSFATPDQAHGVAVSGGYAFVAAGYGGLSVVDVSTPSNPIEVGLVITPGFPRAVAVSGGYAFVAAGSGGLSVVDVSTPSNPIRVARLNTPEDATAVAVSGRYAYVGDSSGGLRVVDVSTPLSPTEVGSFDSPDRSYDVAVAGGYVFVTQDHAGLDVFDISACAFTNLAITKSASPDPVAAGGLLTYTVGVTNFGPGTATEIVVTDMLPAGTPFETTSPNTWSCSEAVGVVTCARPRLSSGTTSELTITVIAPPISGTITNTATVSGAETDPDLSDNTASETTTVNPPAPDPVRIGDPLASTVAVANAGPSRSRAVSSTHGQHVLTDPEQRLVGESILYCPSEADDPVLRAAISDITGGTVDYFDGRAATPDVTTLESYDCVYTWTNHPYLDNVSFGGNLAAAVDGGTVVLLGPFCTHTSGNHLSGEIRAVGYSPVESPRGTNHFESSVYAGDGATTIHEGVRGYECVYRDRLALQGSGLQDGSYVDGEIAHAYRPDLKVIYSNGSGAGQIGGTGYWARLIANACRFGVPVELMSFSVE